MNPGRLAVRSGAGQAEGRMAEHRKDSRKAEPLPDPSRGERSNLEGLRADELRGEPGRETPGEVMPPADGVLVQVCLECGKE